MTELAAIAEGLSAERTRDGKGFTERQREALKWQAFWQRMHALDDEVRRHGTATVAHREIEVLKKQLQSAEAIQDAERIRKRIGRQLGIAYKNIAGVDVELKQHLATAIRPWGKALRYSPEADPGSR